MVKFEIFLLLLGVGALAFFSQMPVSDVATDGSQPPVRPQVQQGSGVGQYDGHQVLAHFSASIFKVVDGDSIRMMTADAGAVDLRLASIDAPELNQAGGRAAKKHLETITAGRTATFLQTDTDRYQRAVVFMFVNDLNSGDVSGGQQEVNAKMVADGFAWHAIQFSSSDRLARLEGAAKAKRLGLWADVNPQPPWVFRDQK